MSALASTLTNARTAHAVAPQKGLSAAPINAGHDVITDQLSNSEWDVTMSAFDDIHYEQSALYAEGGKREIPSHLLIRDESVATAGARLGLTMVPGLSRGLALLRFGPFWRRAGETVDPDNYRAVLDALKQEYCERRKLYLVVRPRPHPDFYPQEAAMLEEAGFARADTSMLDRYFVDISISDDEQMKSLHQKWRAKLRAGLAHNLDIRMGDDDEKISQFRDLFMEMVDRKNLVYAGMNLVDMIPAMTKLPARMKLNLAIAHDQDGPVAGLAFGIVGDIAYYVFGASGKRGFDKNAGYVLQWHVIRHLHASGVARWYELGGPGDPGIRQFKRHLAGKHGLLLPVQEFHYCGDPLSRLAVKAMFQARDLRNRVQRWQRGT